MTDEHVLNVHDLDVAGKAFSAPISAEWLARMLADCNMGPAPGAPEGALELRYSRSGDDVVVNGRVRARVVTPCARCLEPAVLPVDTDLSLLFVPATGPKAAALRRTSTGGEEVELSSDEADLEVYDGDRIVLDPFVREAILLEIPASPLCSEDCPGIAPPPPAEGAGAHAEAIDPRLAPLLALRKRQDPSLASVPSGETPWPFRSEKRRARKARCDAPSTTRSSPPTSAPAPTAASSWCLTGFVPRAAITRASPSPQRPRR